LLLVVFLPRFLLLLLLLRTMWLKIAGAVLGTGAAAVGFLVFVVKTKKPACARWGLLKFLCGKFLPKMKSPETTARLHKEWVELHRSQVAAGDVPEGGICFIGSSTWTFWGKDLLRADLSPLPVYNHGFGGSRMEDVLDATDDLVLKWKPKLIVYYCGVNNINQGDTPSDVVAGFERFVAKVRAASSSVTIAFVAINTSLMHELMGFVEKDHEANARVKTICDAGAGLEFIDPWSANRRLSNDDDLFVFDGLHLCRAGYELLTIVMKPMVQSLWDKVKDTPW